LPSTATSDPAATASDASTAAPNSKASSPYSSQPFSEPAMAGPSFENQEHNAV
jgi:hypothetical protein